MQSENMISVDLSLFNAKRSREQDITFSDSGYVC